MAAAKMPLASSVFGKGGSAPPEPGTDEPEIPEDFEAYAVEAFPELEGDSVRLAALKNAIRACVGASKAGSYDEDE